MSVRDEIKTRCENVMCGAGLMQENLQLGEEVRSLKKQMERQRQESQSEIRRLETSGDELQAQLERTAEDHRVRVDDYRQKIDSLEKQSKSDKQFIEVYCEFFVKLLGFSTAVSVSLCRFCSLCCPVQ